MVSKFKEANQLLRSGKLEEAVATYRAAIEENAGFYGTYQNLGETLWKLGRLDEAIAAFRQVVELNPRAVWGLYQLGELLRQQKQFEEAVIYLRRAVEIKSDVGEFYLSLGAALVELGCLDEAVEYLRRAVELNSLAEAYYYLGVAQSQQKHWSEAVEYYRQGLEINPGDVEGCLGLAKALSQLGKWSEAVDSYRQVLTLSESGEVLFRLGQALGQLKQWEEAIAEYQRAINLGFAGAEVRHHLGYALSQLGRYEEAVVELRQVVEENPRSAQVRHQLGYALSQLQRWREAEIELRKSAELHPKSTSVRRQLENVLQKLRKAKNSVKILEIKADQSKDHFCSGKSEPSEDQFFFGRLDQFTNNELVGWLINKLNPEQACYVDIFINRIFYRRVLANRWRGDLYRSFGSGYHGFQVEIPCIPNCSQNIELTAALGEESVSVKIGKGLQAKPLVLHNFKSSKGWERKFPLTTQLQPPKKRGEAIENFANDVAVIIPIYNAWEAVFNCLTSIIRWANIEAKLILIDDASTDSRLISFLDNYSQTIPNVILYRNPKNLGYTASINKGIEIANDADVVLLNSDTIVTPSWLGNLKIAAYSASDIGTVTPLSDNAGAFSVPKANATNPLPSWLDQDSFARLVTQESLCLYPEVPTGNGFCLYIRRDALDEIGLFDEEAFPLGYGEENDFCMRGLSRGWRNVIDDRTIIYHVRSASFGEKKAELAKSGRQIIDRRYPEYGKAVRTLFTDSPAMATLRFNLQQHLNHYPRFPLPRVLYVIHSESGGTPQTTTDLMNDIVEKYEPFLLISDTNNLKLFKYVNREKKLIEKFNLSIKLTATIHESSDYNKFVEYILIRYGIELIHIRHIGRHGLSLTRTAKKLNLVVIFSFHDYYTITPNVKLLDYGRKYCLDSFSNQEARKNIELWSPESSPNLSENLRRRWQDRMSEMLYFCDAFVTTSERVKEIVESVFPFLKSRDFRVIPHGRNFSRMLGLGCVPSKEEPIRILVPGNLCVAKGSLVLRDIKACDPHNRIEFHFMGYPDKSLDDIGIQHGGYQRDQFLEVAAKIKPHLGAIFSIWPETYCHTLTELWAAGLPVIGFSLGAIGERLQDHGGGWLLDNIEPRQIYTNITQVYTASEQYLEKLDKVLAWQRGYGSTYTTQVMSMQYLKLYELLHQCQSSFTVSPDKVEIASRKHTQIIEIVSSEDDLTVPHHRKALRKCLRENQSDTEFTWQRCSYSDFLNGKNDFKIFNDDIILLSIYQFYQYKIDEFVKKLSEVSLKVICLLEQYKMPQQDVSETSWTPQQYNEFHTSFIQANENVLLKHTYAVLAIGTKSWVKQLSQHFHRGKSCFWTYSVATDDSWPDVVENLVVQADDRIDWLETMKKGQGRYRNHVSVIIPVYGKQDFTRQCLNSIFSLTNSSIPFKIIVMDNGSPDDTAYMIREMQQLHPNLQLICSTENLMFSSGCNLGAIASESEYIVFLNNDTIVSENWLEYLIEPLRQDITIGITGPKLVYPDDTLQAGGIVFSNQSKFPYHIYKGMPANDDAVNKKRYFQALTGACMAMRALDFLAVKGFDPAFVNGCEDLDLCFKIRTDLNKKLLYCPESTITHFEGKTPGRGSYRLHNRRLFVNRWRSKIEVDDFLFYREDDFLVNSYNADQGESMGNELASINADISKF